MLYWLFAGIKTIDLNDWFEEVQLEHFVVEFFER